MKILLLLFAALLLAGCGEKSSSEGSESVTEEPSVTLPLSDADVERLLKEAVDLQSLQRRNDLYYQVNESEPYSGWAKEMYDSGQVKSLVRSKDGELDGPQTAWHENGQKQFEGTFKDGKMDGPMTGWHENGQKKGEVTYKDGEENSLGTTWHENGQKWGEVTYKDGEEVSVKWWNSKGEEVETREESLHE
jgi:hypothetical protein